MQRILTNVLLSSMMTAAAGGSGDEAGAELQ
jgi:hypothetical protein